MRIGIDARELCGRATGAGRYLRGLLAQWSTDARALAHDFVLYAPEPIALTLDSRRFATRLVPGFPGTWWEQVRMPAAIAGDHLDVFFAPAYTAPLITTPPNVVAIHDVSFAAHPEWFSMREGLRRRLISRRAARQARAVITISQFSRSEIVERFGVVESRVHVIPPGIPAPRTPPSAATRPKVLYVGSIFNRRHVPDLVRAFAPVARNHPDASLEIVGDDRTFPRQDLPGVIADAGLNGRAEWRQYVPDDQLAQLYSSSRAFAFLSEYEGLGMTPLEALAAGVPSVLLDTPVARETCGAAALYVGRDDIGAVTRALEQLLFDESTRARLLAAAPATLARYTWPRAARETLALLQTAVRAEI
jgi:glycosyltransferase involved in cell wall biosynthesis